MDARKIMLTFSLNDWEKTSQDELCMNFLSVSDAKIIEKCVLEMKQMVGDLDVFGGHLESFENQTGDLSSKDLQDLWDSMQRSKEHIEEGKKIMDDILYKVLEAKNEASVVSLKKKRAKRMTKAYNLDENGEKTTPRRSTRLRKTTHSDCTGCTPSTAHKNHTVRFFSVTESNTFSLFEQFNSM